MSELEIVLGILASVSALYGFTIAYYVFARGLQLQEEEGVWAANRKGREPKTKEDRDEALGKIAWRRVLLNIFLIGSTISFTFSAWGDLSYLGNPVPEHARQGVVGFQALALGVVVWFVGVGIGNLRDTFRNMSPNKALTQLARTWQELTRSPEPSRRAVVPLVVGGILLVVFLLTLQVQTDYLLRHSYSNEAKNITFVTTAPLWEESVKIGSAVVGGALFSSFGVLGLWIRQKRLGEPRLELGRLWTRGWRSASVIVFGVVATAFAVSESLGGGLDGRVATQLGFAIKILTHPAFSMLAVPVILEARPRAALFIGIGYGFHSMMNCIVNFVPEGFVRTTFYLLGLLFIGCVDFWFLSRWYPPIRAILRKFLPPLR